MAEHIDLGSDLAGFDGGGGGDQGYPQDYTVPRWLGPRHPGSARRIPLAQLQAEGFNTTPPPGYEGPGRMPYPGPRAVADYKEEIQRLLSWPKPAPPPEFRIETWLAGDPSNDAL